MGLVCGAHKPYSIGMSNGRNTDGLVTNASLLAFIREHGMPCRVQADGQLRVASQESGRPGYSWVVEVIEPTLRSVRLWLGY